MKLPVTCQSCTREGMWDPSQNFVHHEDESRPGIVRRWACELPPQVETVAVERAPRYPSPWKMKLRGW